MLYPVTRIYTSTNVDKYMQLWHIEGALQLQAAKPLQYANSISF